MLEEEKFNDKELNTLEKIRKNSKRTYVTNVIASTLVTVFYVVLITLLIIQVVNTAKFHKKVATEFETCVTLEDDLYCKIEK